MNEALAPWEASSGYTAVADVETVMQILANAGYNTENWKCLTQGYEVYWYKNDNRMILYNAAEGAIEYIKSKTSLTHPLSKAVTEVCVFGHASNNGK